MSAAGMSVLARAVAVLITFRLIDGLPIQGEHPFSANALIADSGAKTLRRPSHVELDAVVRTVTPKPPMTELSDIFISVKTTQANHRSRLDVIDKTWLRFARAQTWLFTDGADETLEKNFGDRLIDTGCPRGHSRHALCCKMAAELSTFLKQQKTWFCHFDDDNYVNVPQLVRLLNEYHPSKDWYLGKPSVASPLDVALNYKCGDVISDRGARKFWFATGGAGFCVSRPLVEKMSEFIEGSNLTAISDCIGFPDDVTVGFIIEYMLGVPLTVVDQFHSHYEALNQIPSDALRHQVSLSYGQSRDSWNVLNVNHFSAEDDPTRFHSLNCHLFPQSSGCSGG